MTDRIKITEGVTVNLGNYQSYRLDIEYARDFDPSTTDKDEVFNEVKKYVAKKLKEGIKDKANAKIIKE